MPVNESVIHENLNATVSLMLKSNGKKIEPKHS